MGITAPFYGGDLADTGGYAFFRSGSAITSSVPDRFQVALAGHGYMVDVTKYERTTLDVIRQQADTSNEPSEQSFSPFSLWRRSIDRWHHGAGQDNFDLADESDRARFRTSKGIDVWTLGELSLLADTDEKLSSANTNLKMAVAGARLYVLDGQTVKFTTDMSVDTPSFTDVTGTPAETPTDIATDGFHVWIAFPSGPYVTDTGVSTAAAFGTQDVDLLCYANGRLVAAHDNVLYELDNAGVATLLWTHFNSSFRFDALAPSPIAVYAAGHVGATGEVHRVTVEEASTALTDIFPATQLPDGEYATAILSYTGVVVLGTNRGVRMASVDSAGNLTYGVLIPTPAAVLALEGDDRFVWFGWTGYDATSTGLGRLDLSVFTAALRPAYASDLMVTGSGAVQAVVTFGGLTCFSVSGDGFYAEAAVKVESGTICSGSIRWGTSEHKHVHSVDLRTEPLPAGGSVGVEAGYDAGSFEPVSTLSTQSSTGPTAPFSVRNRQSEQVELCLTLNRATDTTVGPVVLRATLKALVSPPRTEQIVVPIVLHEEVLVGSGDGQPMLVNTTNEFEFLKGIEANGVPVTYQEGDSAYTVVIEKVALREPRGFTRSSPHWLQGICFVTLRTVEG